MFFFRHKIPQYSSVARSYSRYEVEKVVRVDALWTGDVVWPCEALRRTRALSVHIGDESLLCFRAAVELFGGVAQWSIPCVPSRAHDAIQWDWF